MDSTLPTSGTSVQHTEGINENSILAESVACLSVKIVAVVFVGEVLTHNREGKAGRVERDRSASRSDAAPAGAGRYYRMITKSHTDLTDFPGVRECVRTCP